MSRFQRRRDAAETQGTTALELFYDLVFVFAITQVSQLLLEHLTWEGAWHASLVLLVVWWAWNYTTWVTNELDPDSIVVRALLIALMLASLLLAIAIPEAFGQRALLFAGSYVAIQVGRHAFLAFAASGPGTLERERAARILTWFVAAGVFWIAGAIATGPARAALWLLALAIDYTAPLVLYRVPGTRRLSHDAWTVQTAHFAERFQLFMIIALGESIVVTGATSPSSTQHGEDRGVRDRLPRDRGALVAVLQLRRAHRRATARARDRPHPSGARRLHVPARGHGRRCDRGRGRRRGRDRAPDRQAAGS